MHKCAAMRISRRNMLRALAIGVGAGAFPISLAHGEQDKWGKYNFKATGDIDMGRLLMLDEVARTCRVVIPADIDKKNFEVIVARHSAVKGEWMSIVTMGMAFAVPIDREMATDEHFEEFKEEWEYVAGGTYTTAEEEIEDLPRSTYRKGVKRGKINSLVIR